MVFKRISSTRLNEEKNITREKTPPYQLKQNIMISFEVVTLHSWKQRSFNERNQEENFEGHLGASQNHHEIIPQSTRYELIHYAFAFFKN